MKRLPEVNIPAEAEIKRFLLLKTLGESGMKLLFLLKMLDGVGMKEYF